MNSSTCCGARPTNWPSVEHGLEVHSGQQRIGTQTIEQIVLARAGLQRRRDRLTVAANALVYFLPIAALRHGRHQDVLGGHVRENLGHVASDHLGIDDQPVADIQGQTQHGVGASGTLAAASDGG